MAWLHIQPEHPELADFALKLLMPFPTTYNCEVRFSSFVGLKTKQRNWINVDYDMRLKLSSLELDIASLMAQKKKSSTILLIKMAKILSEYRDYDITSLWDGLNTKNLTVQAV